MPEPSALSGALKRPFAEQVAFWRGKLGDRIPTKRWNDLVAEAHDRAFMVAGATKADLLADLAAAVDRAIVEGRSLEDFRADFMEIVQTRGWQGFTGDTGPQARAWRTHIVYTTNAATSYAAGRLAQLKEGGFKYWVYRHSLLSREPRPEHLAWDGRIVPADDPWWRAHYPPSGFGCRCYVSGARTLAGAKRLGGRVEGAPTDPGDRAGVDPGWAYSPGETVQATVRALVEKPLSWPYEIGKAWMSELPPEQRDVLAEAYRRLPSVAADARRYAERALGERAGAPISGPVEVEPLRTLGMLTRAQAAEARAILGESVDDADWSLAADAIRAAGGEVEPEEYAEVPRALLAPDAIRAAKGDRPALEVVARIGEASRRLVFGLDRKRRSLTLRTIDR